MNESPGEHSVDLAITRIADATSRLLATAAELTDDQAQQESLLPGWSRGHVLTHVARNADGLRNLLTWASSGVETPMYPDSETRNAEIEAGSGRPVAELVQDLTDSADAFGAAAKAVPAEGWVVEVRGLRGPAHPAWYTLHRRLFEVEIHHVDLGSGYQPSDWPEWFVDEQIYRITGELTARPEPPRALLTDTVTGRQFFLGAPDGDSLTISGPGAILLAWLLGRDDGASLTADPQGPLPEVPAYG